MRTKIKGLCGHCRTKLTEQNCAPVIFQSGYGFCRDCRNESSRLRYRRDPEPQKSRSSRWLAIKDNRNSRTKSVVAWRRKKDFGITQEQFDAKFKAQNGLCAICKQPMLGQARTKVPCQDHDHKSGKLRDLICISCNLLLGHSYENKEILANAVLYLEKHVGI